MARRTSLREFQANLTKRLAEAQISQYRALLGLDSGKENWLVDLVDTGEILPVPSLSPVPLTQAWFRGIANIRGTLYGVVDFAAFHDMAPTPLTGHARLVLINARHRTNTALLVNRITGLRNNDEFEDAYDTSEQRPWVAETLADLQGHTWRRLDVIALINAPDFLEAAVMRT